MPRYIVTAQFFHEHILLKTLIGVSGGSPEDYPECMHTQLDGPSFCTAACWVDIFLLVLYLEEKTIGADVTSIMSEKSGVSISLLAVFVNLAEKNLAVRDTSLFTDSNEA